MKIKNYELFKGEDLKIADLIQRRRYQLLIHSCIYYHLGDSIIHDSQWDSWAKELVELQQKYPHISEKVTLYEYFKDWDAVTGMCLPITLDWVIGIATKLLYNAEERFIPAVITVKSEVKVSKKSSKRRLF